MAIRREESREGRSTLPPLRRLVSPSMNLERARVISLYAPAYKPFVSIVHSFIL